jgi:3-methyladenine DNA glycosylase AlkD
VTAITWRGSASLRAQVFGVSMANMQALARRLGRSHELAAALWDTGWNEARMLTSFVDEPSVVPRLR